MNRYVAQYSERRMIRGARGQIGKAWGPLNPGQAVARPHVPSCCYGTRVRITFTWASWLIGHVLSVYQYTSSTLKGWRRSHVHMAASTTTEHHFCVVNNYSSCLPHCGSASVGHNFSGGDFWEESVTCTDSMSCRHNDFSFIFSFNKEVCLIVLSELRLHLRATSQVATSERSSLSHPAVFAWCQNSTVHLFSTSSLSIREDSIKPSYSVVGCLFLLPSTNPRIGKQMPMPRGMPCATLEHVQFM
jgi:hypothetical protein